MSEHKTILEMLGEAGMLPPKPEGTEYAIKYVQPDWTTYNGYQWPYPGEWTPEESEWDPAPCASGGVHVAFNLRAAQSGGGLPHHCLVVAYRPDEAGYTEGGKLKVKRALTLAPVDLLSAIRTFGGGAYLQGAHLRGAYLGGAYLRGADLGGAYLQRASLRGADLGGAYLGGADLQGASLRGAYLGGAYLQRASLRGADLGGAYLQRASLRGADLQGAWTVGAIGLESEAT